MLDVKALEGNLVYGCTTFFLLIEDTTTKYLFEVVD